MKATEAKRLKELELENARLKKAVAELTLDKLILKEANDLLGEACSERHERNRSREPLKQVLGIINVNITRRERMRTIC